MSPLLGSYGGSSEYAYRGTIDDWPNDFSFIDQFDLEPGGVYTSNTATITGINNRAIVRVSAGASVAINGGSYVIPTEASPVFIKNNQTISVRVPTTFGTTSDFNKTYATTVSVGKKSTRWTIRTRLIDADPVSFTFTNLTGREVGTAYTSNEIIVSGLQSGFAFPASIISGQGSIIVNGGSPSSSTNVINGDRLYLRLTSPLEYSNYPTGSGTKTSSTGLQLANYSTSWSISTRDPDLFINPFDFIDVNNAALNSSYTAGSVNPTTGITTTITGADVGLPLTTVISGCELRVEQPTAGGVFSIRRDYSTANTIVYNGDRLTARVSSGSTYSETKIGIVTVSNHTAQFIVTTRPRPVDTIPDSFSGTFTDLTSQARNTLIQSNEITLSGITTYGDQGVASITTGSNGGAAEFQVTRGTTVVRAYGITTSYVQQGDKIRLRLTSSPDSNITRTATFRVDGIDTNTIITGQSGFQDDIWSVNTATRQCGITTFSFNTLNNVNPNTLQSTTFVAQGFDSDCRMVVSTSNANSYLSVPGSTATNNIAVSPGTTVTVYMTSGDYFATRTTTVTLSNTSNSVVPASSYSANWTVNTVDDTRNTSVTLSSNRTSIQLGQTITLSWTSINAVSVTGYTGNGFTPTTVTSTGVTVTPTTIGTVRYSITVLGPPSAGNYATQIAANPQGVTSFVDITVTEDTTPDSFTMNPSTRTGQTRSSYSSFTAQSTVNSSVSVTGLSAPTLITASCSSSTGSDVYFTVNGSGRNTSASVKNNDVIVLYLQNSSSYSTTVRASLTIGSNTQSVSSTSEACVVTTGIESIATNVSITTQAVIGTYQNGSGFAYQAYTGKTGPAINSKCKSDLIIDSKNPFTSPGSLTVPNGATSAYIACIAGGGGGGGDSGSGNDFAGGGGGGGASYANISVSAGGQFSFTVGGGGNGATDGGGQDGGDSTISYNGIQQIRAGGGRNGQINSGGSGGGGQFNGGDGQGENPWTGPNFASGGSGGAGGGAGVLGGGTSPPGLKNKSKGPGDCTDNSSGGGGGGGAGTGQVPAGVTPGPDSTCSDDGQPGANYGGGGGGGARGGRGGRGAPGQVRINLSGSVAAPTWNSLIDTIVNAYRNNAFRPPSGSEIRTWAGPFTANPATTLPELNTSIVNAINANLGGTRASSITNSCGGPL